MALVLVVCLIPLLVSGGPVDRPEWQYDDYRQIEGVTAASGSLELVTVGDVEYVHAHELGSGSYTLNDGDQVEVSVSRAVLDVFLITGQSNAAYSTAYPTAAGPAVDPSTVDPSTASPVPPPGTAYYYGTDTWYDYHQLGSPSFRSLTSPDGGAVLGDKAPVFCATYHQETGHKVYWICGAYPGRAMETFVPNSGATWLYMMVHVPAALAAVDQDLYELVPRGYMWIQGESDSSDPVDTYKEEFLAMHEAILAGRLGMVFDHCFMSLIAYGNAQTAQLELSEEYPTITMSTEAATTFTDANGLLGDGLHYSQAGDNIIGAALGASCAEYYAEQDTREGPVDGIVAIVPVLIVLGLAVFVASVLIARRY